MISSLANEFDRNLVADLLAANDRRRARQILDYLAIDHFHRVAQVQTRAIGGAVWNDFRESRAADVRKILGPTVASDIRLMSKKYPTLMLHFAPTA